MSTTVTVGCKLPHGLICEIGDMVSEKGPNDGRFHVRQKVTLKGVKDSRVIGGYGITEDVDADFMKAWLLAHKDDVIVKTGLVFVEANTKSAADKAKAGRNIKTGLEPADPKNLPAQFKKIKPFKESDVESDAA